MITKTIKHVICSELPLNTYGGNCYYKELLKHKKKFPKWFQKEIINQYDICGWPLIWNYNTDYFDDIVYIYITQSPSKDFRKPKEYPNKKFNPSLKELICFIDSVWEGHRFGKLEVINDY